MAERKVLNKYYPPDFDPAKINPRAKRPANQQINVRMMLPMSIRCNTCGNYIYKGTKFNSRKEDVMEERDLGIQILRFYFKCIMCSAEITIKTDPQNSDYVVESGAARNFKPWRVEDVADEEQQRKNAEETGDAMKSLENRTLYSKREMDILGNLDEIKSINSRPESVTVDAKLETLQRPAPVEEEKFDEGDEALIRTYFHGSREFVQRINDDDLDEDELTLSTSHDAGTLGSSLKRRKVKQKASDSPKYYLTTASSTNRFNNKEDPRDGGPSRGGKFLSKSSPVSGTVTKKLPEASTARTPVEGTNHSSDEEKQQEKHNVLHSLCQQYDSDEDN